MESLVPFRLLDRKHPRFRIVQSIFMLLVSVLLAGLLCADCFANSDQPGFASVKSPFTGKLKQDVKYNGNTPNIRELLARDNHGALATTAEPGIATATLQKIRTCTWLDVLDYVGNSVSLLFELAWDMLRVTPGLQGLLDLTGMNCSATSMTRRAMGGRSLRISADSSNNETAAPPVTEVDALVAFKAGIMSDPSDALRSWVVGATANASNVCSEWAGVTCSPQYSNHVVALNVSNLQLEGGLDEALMALRGLPSLQSLDLSINVFSSSIPAESLTNFSQLSYLNVSYNLVTGGIPSEVGKLSSLRDLDLSDNNITDLIPESLGNCSLLTSILLGENLLEGEIPAWLGTLPALMYLNVSSNSLSGSIPGAVGNCSSLRLLDLSSNVQLSGELPEEMSQLKQLQKLFADYSGLSGSFPIWIGNLTSLVEFSMYSASSLEGGIPDSIGQIHSLELFKIADNQMTGSIPLSICNLTSLRSIQILFTGLSGPIPPQIGRLENLVYLNLAGNQLTGVIPSSLANCSILEDLELGSNELMDPEPIPLWLEQMTNLTGLYLSNMNLQGDLPQFQVAKLFNLQQFDVANNNLTGKIPAGLQNCTHLTNIDVSGNQLTGGIPQELGVLRYLSHFIAEKCSLTGSFPEYIANWTLLSLFSIQHNSFSGLFDGRLKMDQFEQLGTFAVTDNAFVGPIPEAFSNSTTINLLVLSQNQLSGPIPASLGNMTSLEQLYLGSNILQGPIPAALFKSDLPLGYVELSHNKLEGNIPPEIGQLIQLEDLLLGDNKLTGEVPSSIGNCTKIIVLDLSNNQFEGDVPGAAISRMSFLTALNLSNNLFSGSWPKEFSKLNALQIMNLSSNNISGSILLGLGQCVDLNSLDVSLNKLTGEIPQDLGQLSRLQFFNASFNDFMGPIPQSGIFNSNRINESSFLGNPNLCGPVAVIGLQHQACAAMPRNVSSHGGHCKRFTCRKVWMPVSIVSLVLMALIAILLLGGVLPGWTFLAGSRRRVENVDHSSERSHLMLNFDANVRFTEQDVLQTIEDPSGDNVIGAGARSIVYKGVLPGGQMFALKRLLALNHEVQAESADPKFKDSEADDLQSQLYDREVAEEAKILAKLQHRNILKCLGYYSGPAHKALIVEYMSRGSLEKHLHQMDPCNLGWQARLRIAVGVAQALKYLHHDFPEPVIHRDLKSSNILLDDELESNIGDFGISKFVGAHRDGEATASSFCGTMGYTPPEYGGQPWVSTKGDVYSYGIVLIELLTLRQPWSTNASDEQGDLRSWVAEKFSGKPLVEVMDPFLVAECSLDGLAMEQMMSLMRITLFCTRVDPQMRPSMIDVVGMLTHIINLGGRPVTRRTVEDLAHDIDTEPAIWTQQDLPSN